MSRDSGTNAKQSDQQDREHHDVRHEFVPTTENGDELAGKRVFRISGALSSRRATPACTVVEKKTQGARPASR